MVGAEHAGGAELAGHEVPFGAHPRGPFRVVPPLGLVELFAHVRRVAMDNPFNSRYELRRAA